MFHFAPLGLLDLPTLTAWFEDEELGRRLGGMLLLPGYLDYVWREPGHFAWLAWDGDRPVGAAFLQLEPDQPQTFAFLVAPALRGRGYGQLIVQTLLTQPEAAGVETWQVCVELDNVASRRCLAAAGFTQESADVDADGFLPFVLSRS